ncbi:MAG: hypothetical protein EOL95_09235 [Bacteroidia bacterium]|nr:hypothetical protein [Bacteroidia bacterium]
MLTDYNIEHKNIGGKEESILYIKTDKKQKNYGELKGKVELSEYQPDGAEKDMIYEIRKNFQLGEETLTKPRREFNDLSVLDRAMIDQMAYNNFMPNDGDYNDGDPLSEWRSNAQRPIIRNKVLSIGAHATANVRAPRVFACDDDSNEQKESEEVMSLLMDLDNSRANYIRTYLYTTLTALFQPASIVYREYSDVYRMIRTEEEDEKGNIKSKLIRVKDEEKSGPKSEVVPVEEILIPNFYENDIQEQDWVIRRRIISYDTAKLKYSDCKNVKYLKPGISVIFDDANQGFYDVYDPEMRDYLSEEVTYWNKSKDIKISSVNGIIMGECDKKNPRKDGRYPFAKMYYETMDEGKCFYGMSLAAKMTQDAKIINTLYQMMIDGTYLKIMPPMVAIGSDMIGNDVMIPGLTTTLTDEKSSLKPITNQSDTMSGFNMLSEVEKSIDDTSVSPVSQGQATGSTNTAYEISRLERNASTMLGLFNKMQADFSIQYGMLVKNDIIQYYTMANIEDILGKDSLMYEQFIIPSSNDAGRSKNAVVRFKDMDEIKSKDEYLEKSYKLLEEEKKESEEGNEMNIYEANPILFRNAKYSLIVDSEIMNPNSKDLERAYKLEAYDRMIQNPLIKQDLVTKDFLLGAYSDLFQSTEKYMQDEQPMQNPMMNGQQPNTTPGNPQNNMNPSETTLKSEGSLNNLINK